MTLLLFFFFCFFASIGSPVIINGEEFENIEIPSTSENLPEEEFPSNIDTQDAEDRTAKWIGHTTEDEKTQSANQASLISSASESVKSCDIIVTGAEPEKRASDNDSDMLHDLVRNKDLLKARKKTKGNSVDSEVSEGSTLVSSSSDNPPEEDWHKKPKPNHHLVRNTMSDSEMELSGVSLNFKYLFQPLRLSFNLKKQNQIKPFKSSLKIMHI